MVVLVQFHRLLYELCCCRYLDDFTTHFSGFHLAHFNGCVEHTRWQPRKKKNNNKQTLLEGVPLGAWQFVCVCVLALFLFTQTGKES